MRDRRHAYVKCPFFKRERDLNIRCEGGSRVRMNSKASIDDWLSRFCCSGEGWQRCTIARQLRIEYEEADEMGDAELNMLRGKMVQKQREIKRLREELDNANKAIRQMNRSVDSIITVACTVHGEETSPGTFVLRLPEIRIEETLKTYAVFAEKDPETGEYVVTAAKRKP